MPNKMKAFCDVTSYVATEQEFSSFYQVVEAVEALADAVEHIAAFVRKSAGKLPLLDPQAAVADGVREGGVGGVTIRHRQPHEQSLEDGGADCAIVVAADWPNILQTQRPWHL